MAAQSSSAPRLVIVATGGTIANTPDGRLPVEQVLDDIERAHAHQGVRPRSTYDIEVLEVEREGAERFDPATWLRIGAAVQAACDRDDVDGVVVTHGTYTVEETAYFLHLTVDTHKPLVVTCSQRKHSTVGNDGDRNLVDALAVATAPAAAGQGALMVVHEEVHCAREVVKGSRRPGGFVSPVLGPLGLVDEDGLALYRAPLRRHTNGSAFARLTVDRMPYVEIVATHPGALPVLVEAAGSAGAEGVVLHGYTFKGKPYHGQEDALGALAGSGVPVVFTSRGRDGRVPRSDTPDAFVRGDTLVTSKAHVLLTVALAAGLRGTEELQPVFDTH